MIKNRWLILVLILLITGVGIAEQPNKPEADKCIWGENPLYPIPNTGMNPSMNIGVNPGGPGMLRFDAIDQLMLWEQAAKLLDLSPEQKKQIETIFIEQKKKNIRLKAELEVQKIDLLNALRDTTIDEAQIKEISRKIGRLTAEMIESGIDSILQAKKVLTPEQQKKALQFIQRLIQRRSVMPMLGQGQHPPIIPPGSMPREYTPQYPSGFKSFDESEPDKEQLQEEESGND
ncbi:MAG: Spy/CpxP family protein refolding chaperone [bacterium]|nr:Spy/CpxP family protein refolding chaperone [bacterium]